MLPKLFKSMRLERKSRKLGESGRAVYTVLVNSRGQEVCTVACDEVDRVWHKLNALQHPRAEPQHDLLSCIAE